MIPETKTRQLRAVLLVCCLISASTGRGDQRAVAGLPKMDLPDGFVAEIAVLSSLANQPVRIRFQLKNGKLFAFRVSPETSGASRGYVAAGGPGFSSNRDTGNSSK